MQQPPRKKSLAICKIYAHLTRPRKLYRYERRTGWTPSFDVLQLEQAKRQEIAQFANRSKCYLLVDCPRLSPLPLASSFMSHKLQHIRRFAIQQNDASRQYNVAIEAQKQKEWHPMNLSEWNKLRQRMVLTHFWNQHSSVICYTYNKSFSILRAGFSWCDALSRLILLWGTIPHCYEGK